jgi:hypothetical protein
MSVEIQWNGTCPETGGRRIIHAERFARGWRFKYRNHRRDDWSPWPVVPRAVWEELLEAMERRYRRREGITDADLQAVRGMLATLKPTVQPAPVNELGHIQNAPQATEPQS